MGVPPGWWVRVMGALAVLLTPAVSIEVREPENEVVTPSPTLDTPDNGMAVGEAPGEVSLGTPLLQVPEEEAVFSTVRPAVDAIFPENHRVNFTASPYAGTIETPPLLSNFNKYQEAYKQYYAQKNEFINAKPIKFEENHSKNHYVTASNGLSAYGEEEQAARNKPFPNPYAAPHDAELDQSASAEAEHATHSLFTSPLSGLFPYARGPQPDKSKTDVAPPDGKQGSWKKTLRFLTTVIPFGIILATLTPNILQINTAEDTRPSRLRSLEEDPLVGLVERLGGLEAIDDPVCEDRFFCEMAVLGKRDTSNFVEKGFWFLANETPDDMAEEAGMKQLFNAIRTESCHLYDCTHKPKQELQPKSETHPTLNVNKEPKPKKMKKFFRS